MLILDGIATWKLTECKKKKKNVANLQIISYQVDVSHICIFKLHRYVQDKKEIAVACIQHFGKL